LLAVFLALPDGPAWAQVSGNSSLSGKYYFRQVMLVADATASVTDTRTATGILTFDGNGNVTISGDQLIGTAASSPLSSTGVYAVKPGGYVTLANPLRSGSTINARLGQGALVGSSTEVGATVFDLFIALPAPQTTALVSGPYWISTLEFPNGGTAAVRNANFKLTANGAGSFLETTVTGQASNLGNVLQTQTVGAITYQIAADGTGTLNFPTGSDPSTQLVAGVKNIYVSSDASLFIGGSKTAGGHGLIVGVKAPAANASWSGFYQAAGLRYDLPSDRSSARFAAGVGAVNATSLGSIWARRLRQSDGFVFDASSLLAYTLGTDGSGAFSSITGHINVGSTGQVFTTSGVDALKTTTYELNFGIRMLSQSGTGVFLNPQGVLNAASFAPPGYPLSPGGVVTLYGSGFGNQNVTATTLPFPPTLGGVQVTINNLPAPIYAVGATASSPFVSAVVPFAATGSTATIVVTVNGVKSNPVDAPLAATAPGIFSLTQNGLGDGAVLHANFSLVNAASPAISGETVQVFLTGLGAVNPPVVDGAAAPGREPLARTTTQLRVTVGGLPATVSYQGLAPTLGGLYQLNIQIPPNLGPGTHSIAVQTAEAFTDLTSIRVSH
jgi:uncharacterized protein (TIGR03437 family)